MVTHPLLAGTAAALVCFMFALPATAKAPARVTSTGHAEHWAERSVHVTLDPSLASLGPHAVDDVRAAFGAWLVADPGLPHMVFEVAPSVGVQARDGVSRILATRNVAPGHEKDVAYTVSYADVTSGAIAESDIVFNLAYAFGDVSSRACDDAWDIGSVATHETGHFLGLAEDMSDEKTTMWFRTEACDVHKRTLADSDVAAILDIYEPVLRAHCSVGEGPAAPGGAFWTVAPIIALYIRRRRRSS